MNYAEFAEYIETEFPRQLMTRFGIPEHAARDIAHYAEVTGIAEEAIARNDAQFEINFNKHGPSVMRQRLGKSRQALRKRFNRIIQKKMETAVSAQVVTD